MSGSFDPYHKWLGISPKDQPPDHYRLLGVERFESDAEVIDAAANRMMTYLQGLSAGDHPRACQKLLSEISTARLCLLDDDKRAAYEEELRGAQAAAEKPTRRAVRSRPPKPLGPPPAPRQRPAPRPPAAVPPPSQSPSQAPSHARRHSAYQARQRKPWILGVALAAVTLAVAGLGIWVLARRANSERPAEARKAAAAIPVTSPMPDRTAPNAPANGTGGATAEAAPGPVAPVEVPPDDLPHVPDETPPPVPSDPSPGTTEPDPEREAELAALLAQAETALTEKRVPEGIALLEEYLADPAAPQQAKARQLLDHARWATSDERAMAVLRQMNAAQLDGIARGRLRVNLTNIEFNPPGLLDVFQESLRRNVDKARELLAASTPPAPEQPEPGTPEPGTPAPSFDPVRQPVEFLESQGLTARGAFWVLNSESDAAERLEPLSELEKNFKAAAKVKSDEFKKLAVARQRFAAAEQQYKQYEQAQTPPPPALVAFLQQWQQKLATPEAVAAIPAVKQALAALLAAHDPLTLAVLREKTYFDGVRERYRQLADDPQVAEALSSLPSSVRPRLGPSRTFQRAQTRFGKLEQLVLTDRVPVTRHGQHFHLHLIVNETAPADILYRPEFKFDNAGVSAMFTDAVLKAAKIEVQPPYDSGLMIGDQRGKAKLVTVPSIRIGRHVIKDIQAFALAPDSAALGSQIGAELFDGYKTELNREEFYFELEPRNLPME